MNKENLKKLSRDSKAWSLVLEDVRDIEELFDIKLGPKTKEDNKHKVLTTQILQAIKKGQNPSNSIIKAALLRKSLG